MDTALTLMGIDPGSRTTGYAVVRWQQGRLIHLNHGVIALDTQEPFNIRLGHLGHLFVQVLNKYEPDQVIVEKVFLGKNTDSAFKLGHARGIIISEASRQKKEIFEYETRLVKKGITGSGSATKDQVKTHLQLLLGLTIQHLDASDALAMACFQAFQLQKQKLLQRMRDL